MSERHSSCVTLSIPFLFSVPFFFASCAQASIFLKLYCHVHMPPPGMTISGTVIMLEAAGNMVYLLPLMVTFGAARYTGEWQCGAGLISKMGFM